MGFATSGKSELALATGGTYTILADVACNMRSGFLLLDGVEALVYANASARRLLRIADDLPAAQLSVDVRAHLVALACDPVSTQAELDRLWLHPQETGLADLALTDAALRWLRVQCFPIYDPPDRLLGRGILLDDITLERSAAWMRNETLAQAAHELKTPLAIIKGSATTLLSDSLHWDTAMQREMLQMIDTQADRLHDILNALLDVWRLDANALRLSEVQLSEILRPLVERWRRNAPRHRILYECAAERAPILCDPARLEHVFQQLLYNAVTCSPAGGTICLHLSCDEGEVRLSVSDQGRGIAPEQLDRLFDRCDRVSGDDEQAQGSRLGLAVARAVIEAHGGRIWAESAGLGQGAIFSCALPFVPPGVRPHASSGLASPVHLASQRSLPTGHALRRTTVAVVEGDPRMARYLRAHLEEQRYRVQVFSQATQFLHQFDLEEPELVLLATRLADMAGSEVLQRLREFSQLPIVMLCAEDDEDERVHLLDLGADDLVSKPFGMRELQARLRVLLRRQAAQSTGESAESIFACGQLLIDYAQHQVLLADRLVQLSRTEYKLLSTLARNAGRVMTHELLLERVWGAEYNREVDFIWVYISRLRRKIEPDPRHPRYILTVPDVGYKLVKE
jgi:DNA-binding response OmpR family regulator/signal transduction histidine kinase